MDNDVFHIDETGFTGDFGGETAIPTSYEDLGNKPSINGVELSGDKTTEDLGIVVPAKVSDLENDADYQNADEVGNLINAAGVTIKKNAAPCVISNDDLGTKNVYSLIQFYNNLVRKKSGTPTPSNPIEYYTYDVMRYRQYILPAYSSVDIGIPSASAGQEFEPLFVYENIAVTDTGAIIENASYNTYAFPMVKNANYNLYGDSSYDVNQHAFLADTMPAVGQSVTVLNLDPFSPTTINAGNKKFLFYSRAKTSTMGIPVIPIDGFNTSSSSSPYYNPVSYNDLTIRCRINGENVPITGCYYDITPDKRGLTQLNVYYDCAKMDVVDDADNNGVFDLQFVEPIEMKSNTLNGCNKLKLASSGNYTISSINNKKMRLTISDCANMTKNEIKSYLETADIKITFGVNLNMDYAEIIIDDNITFEDVGYYCGGQNSTGTSITIEFLQTPSKLLSIVNNKADIDGVVPMPTKPTANGTYSLKLTKSGNTYTYSWVKDS